MSFIWSSLLYLLILVPLLVWLYVRSQRQRRAVAARYGSLGVVQAPDARANRRRHIPALLFLLGITVLITSAARPQAVVSVPKLESTVILTFDVSGSMAADDLKPTRMEAAKAAAGAFVQEQPSNVAIGVVAFSDGGITVQAPTTDKTQTLETIYRLVPRRGTSMGNGILVALNTIVIAAGDTPILNSSAPQTQPEAVPEIQGWYPSSAIVLLGDGENTQDPDPLLAADLAADLSVRIYTIGVGKPEGALINIEGFSIMSQLNEGVLQEISQITGGQYYNAASEEDLLRVYRDLQPQLAFRTEEIEVTALFAAAGFWVFLLAGALSLLWFGRVP